MGYVYDMDGQLCCDSCHRTEGGVQKRRCPWNYCPPPALCTDCRRLSHQYFTREYHRGMGCEEGHKRVEASGRVVRGG